MYKHDVTFIIIVRTGLRLSAGDVNMVHQGSLSGVMCRNRQVNGGVPSKSQRKVQQSREKGSETVETKHNGVRQRQRRHRFIHPRLLGGWKGQAVKHEEHPAGETLTSASALGHPASSTPLLSDHSLAVIKRSFPSPHHSTLPLYQFPNHQPPHYPRSTSTDTLPFLPTPRRLEYRLLRYRKRKHHGGRCAASAHE